MVKKLKLCNACVHHINKILFRSFGTQNMNFEQQIPNFVNIKVDGKVLEIPYYVIKLIPLLDTLSKIEPEAKTDNNKITIENLEGRDIKKEVIFQYKEVIELTMISYDFLNILVNHFRKQKTIDNLRKKLKLFEKEKIIKYLKYCLLNGLLSQVYYYSENEKLKDKTIVIDIIDIEKANILHDRIYRWTHRDLYESYFVKKIQINLKNPKSCFFRLSDDQLVQTLNIKSTLIAIKGDDIVVNEEKGILVKTNSGKKYCFLKLCNVINDNGVYYVTPDIFADNNLHEHSDYIGELVDIYYQESIRKNTKYINNLHFVQSDLEEVD